jgi:selenocysteine lyase/cysteine desulfurase
VDGAQAVAHFRVNVLALGCDFYVFSGHKLFAPTGIGALYGRRELLEEMPPWQGGGSMIDQVTFDHTTFAAVPYKFEAGTGNIAAAVGLGAAIDYVQQIGFEAAEAHEHNLTNYATQSLSAIRGLTLIGTAARKVGVFSFVLDGIETARVGQFLDQEGIAVRAGHHCAQPSLRHFNLDSTVRPSIAFYNTREDIDALAAAIVKAQRVLK